MIIYEDDVNAISRFAARNVAQKLGVKEADFMSSPELVEEVHHKDIVAHKKLLAFLESYSKWFEFHKRMEAAGKTGSLSNKETEELLSLMKQRDHTRSELVEYIANLP